MKKLFFIFFALIFLGSLLFLNQVAPIPTTPTPPPSANSIGNNTVPGISRSFLITTNPSGATVRIDGKELGGSPLSVAYTQSSYTVNIILAGYEDLNATLIPAESRGVFHFDLKPLTTTPSTSTITNPSDSTTGDNDSDNLLYYSPNIPEALSGLVVVPYGYRFPDNADIGSIVFLEIIPPPESNQELGGIEESNLISKLSQRYYFDPSTTSVQLDSSFAPASIVIFDQERFRPTTSTSPSGSPVVWFNHSTTTCQLRSDPQSPIKFNQLVPGGKVYALTGTEKGIYIFYCQGNPGPTHTIVIN
ncbi:PEGA domain-containing protein [Candidatus Gracilibacteria bacterium]|nr:PEGA domain-containing protein [Candidatus Gracilibacteria bacterium]